MRTAQALTYLTAFILFGAEIRSAAAMPAGPTHLTPAMSANGGRNVWHQRLGHPIENTMRRAGGGVTGNECQVFRLSDRVLHVKY